MSIQSMLIHRCDVFRVAQTADGRGGYTEDGGDPASDTAVASDVHCRVQPLSAKEIAAYASVNMNVTYKVYFSSTTIATGVTLNAKDRLANITNATGTAVVGTPTLDIVGLRDTDMLNRLVVAECS